MRTAGTLFFLAIACPLAQAEAATQKQGKPLDEWTQRLEAKDAMVRVQACQALGDLRREGKAAVAPLIKALADKDANVRYAAACALGRIGPPAKEAVPALVKIAQQDADKGVRVAAIEALGDIGPQANEALPAVLAAVGNRDVELALAAVRALRGLGVSDMDVTA